MKENLQPIKRFKKIVKMVYLIGFFGLTLGIMENTYGCTTKTVDATAGALCTCAALIVCRQSATARITLPLSTNLVKFGLRNLNDTAQSTLYCFLVDMNHCPNILVGTNYNPKTGDDDCGLRYCDEYALEASRVYIKYLQSLNQTPETGGAE